MKRPQADGKADTPEQERKPGACPASISLVDTGQVSPDAGACGAFAPTVGDVRIMPVATELPEVKATKSRSSV